MVMVLTCGFLLGCAFAVLGLPLPAPQSVQGVAGIVALWGGWQVVYWFVGGR